MNLARSILATMYFCFFVNSSFAGNLVTTEFKEPASAIESAIESELKAADAIKTVVTFINEMFHLSEPLKIIFGGEDGPLYDSENSEILIPYSFIREVKARFIAAKYSETGLSSAEATMDALMHTLFHELAHALIFMYEIPVVGKEEDAADFLATVLLIEFFEEGQEIAISAADLFDLESGDVEAFRENYLWDEHSLDVERFYSTLCNVYGSSPEKYAYIQGEADFSEERAGLCVAEYETISSNWLVLLEPYIKRNQDADSL